MGGAHAVGEDEREPGRRRLVDDDAPRLVRREEREHVRDDVDLSTIRSHGVSRQQHEANAELAGELLERAAARARRRRGRGRARGSPAAATARTSVSSPFSGDEPCDREDRDIVGREPAARAELVPPPCERVGPLAERRDVDRVREDVDPLRDRRRARASTRARASRRRGRRAAPRTIRRDDGALHRPAPARAARRARSTRRAGRRARGAGGTTRSRPARRTCSSRRRRRRPGRAARSAPKTPGVTG